MTDSPERRPKRAGARADARFPKASIVAVVLVVAAIAGTASAASGLPKLLASNPRGADTWQVKPGFIVYTGDGSGFLGGFDGNGYRKPGHLVWSSWTRTFARGSGAVWIDDCNPDCADGTFTPHPFDVVAFRPISRRFTRLTLTYAYHGKRYVDKRGIARNGGSWSYYIVGHP